MDLQEWDLLSDDGFIDQENDLSPKSIPNTPTLIDMNYFQKFSDPPKNSGVIIPIPIQFETSNNQDENFEEIPEEEVTKFPIESTTTKSFSDNQQMIKEVVADHQETVTTQISFKKLMENEFVDMKMDSPKSLNRGLLPQIDMGSYQFEEKEKNEKEEEDEIPNNKNEKNSMIKKVDHDNNNNSNVWKWAMTGIGALCSFGFAAATVSLIVLGNRHRESCNNSKKQAELHFQLYSHDKRFKQVVHHATKINEALTAMRGAPVTHAHVTIGGYHESL